MPGDLPKYGAREGAIELANGTSVQPADTTPVQNVDAEKESKKETAKENKESEPPPPSLPYFQLFRYGDHLDYLYMFLGTVGAIVNGAALPVFFIFLGRLLDSFGDFVNGDPQVAADNVAKYALYFVYLALVALGAAYAEVSFWMQTGERQSARVRSLYLRAILRQDVGYFDVESSTGDVVGRVSTDTLLFQDAVGEKVGNFIHNIATFVAGYAVGFSQIWQLAAVMAAFIPILAIPGVLYARILTGLTAKESEAYSEAGSVAEQAISAVRTVYSFVGEAKTLESYSKALQKSFKTGTQQGVAKGVALGANGLTFCMWSLIFWYGGELVIKNEASGGRVLGTAFAVIIGGLALGQALPNLKAFATGRSAAYRIFTMIERIPAIDSDDPHGQVLDKVVGNLELRHVSFAYPSRPDVRLFDDFNLVVPAGKTVALVGSSGSGKSTVIALLERFYDPLAGQVLVDGVNIKSLQLKWLRKQIGLVSQEPALFATTIKENILYGLDGATDEEVEAAAKAANAYNFIMGLPDKFDTQVGERGVQMSGGQKQRIAIARAILKNPPILLLDEATSALDTESERIVQEALDKASVGRTTVVVAHRLSTIRNADTIAVVQAGRVVEQGSHDELIGLEDGAYSSLVNLQNKRQEVGEEDDDHEGADQKEKDKARISTGSAVKAEAPKGVPLSVSALSQGSEGVAGGAAAEGKPPKPSFARLLAMNKPELPYAILGTIGAICVGCINPVWAFIVAGVINIYFSTDPDYIRDEALKYAYVFIGFGVFSLIANLVEHYFYGLMGEHLTKRVRERMLATILRQEVGWFDQDENSSGALLSKLGSDAQLVRALVGDRMCLLVQAIAGVGGSVVLSVFLLWKLALLMLATLPLIILSFLIENLMLKGFSAETSKAQEEASQVAGESVAQHRTVTAFSSQDKVLGLFKQKLEGPQKKSWIRSQIAGLGLGIGQFVLYTSWGLALWYGSRLSLNEGASFEDVFKVFLVIVAVGFGMAEAMAIAPDFTRGGQAVESVFSILDRQPAIEPDSATADTAESVQGHIDVQKVTFAYPARPDVVIFDDFSLTVQAGTMVALVGQSGSGKSTIVGLIERFYDPQAGRIMIDGKDIRKYNLQSLRRHVGLVQQEPVLFATTIRENIMYGMEHASESEVIAASKAANAHEFISALPDGYDTFCGERGTQMSGGQKQRIAIARAVLKNPAILLLDEATSALDAESEKVVQDALDRIMVNRTTIVIAHRLTTIRHATSIAVLQQGKLVEQGSHESLLRLGEGGAYHALIKLQTHGA